MISLTYITDILMAMACMVFLLGSLVLYKGGWNWYDESRREPTYMHKWLSVGLLVSGIGLLAQLLANGVSEPLSPTWRLLIMWSNFLPMAIVPLQATLLMQERLRLRSLLFCFLPLALYLPPILLWGTTAYEILYRAEALLYVYLIALYAVMYYRLIRWDKHMKDAYSDVTSKQTHWFRHLTLPLMLLTLIWIPIYFFPEAAWILPVYFVVEICITTGITAFALHQESFEVEPEEELPTKEEESASPIWVEKMTRLMEEEHLYRQSGLTRDELAKQIGVNRTYLSVHLNKELSTTFYDYINGYRLEEAAKLLRESRMTVETVSEHCGFSSRIIFARLFKAKYNCSPSDYR